MSSRKEKYTPKTMPTKRCALPGCSELLPNAWYQLRQETCCRSHGQKLRRLRVREILAKDMREGQFGHSASSINAVKKSIEVLTQNNRKVDEYNIFGELLKLSDADDIEYYDENRGGFSNPAEIAKVFRLLT